MYMVTQNPFQGCRIDFREQRAKSRKVKILDGEKIMQITAVNIACLRHRWRSRYSFLVFLVSVVWICVCCL